MLPFVSHARYWLMMYICAPILLLEPTTCHSHSLQPLTAVEYVWQSQCSIQYPIPRIRRSRQPILLRLLYFFTSSTIRTLSKSKKRHTPNNSNDRRNHDFQTLTQTPAEQPLSIHQSIDVFGHPSRPRHRVWDIVYAIGVFGCQRVFAL